MIVGSFGTLFIKVKVMTENTSKKPRRKRRTKVEIEAEKAAKLAAEQEECQECQDGADALAAAEAALEKEVKTDDVIVEMLEESVVTSAAPVNEDTAESVSGPASKPPAPYVTLTGLQKLRNRLSQRKLRDEHYEALRKKK